MWDTIPNFFGQNWLAQAKEVEATSQGPKITQLAALVVKPTQQTTASITFTQPATVPAAPPQSMVTLCDKSQKSPYCTPAAKQCPTEYPNAPPVRLVSFRGGRKRY